MSSLPPRRLEARLRFRQLEVVRAIAEAGSVRGAAERLSLSAPAVSKALAETEHALGCELFTRLPRGMTPTPRGERILSHARLLLNELDYFLSDAITGEGVNQGLLRLGASPYVGNRILPALLASLRHRETGRPPTVIQIREGRLRTMLEKLLAGELDALLTIYTPDDMAGIDTTPLVVDPLRDDPLVVLGPPGLVAARPRKRSWAELAAVPWILPPHATQMRRVVDGMFYRATAVPPVPAIEGSNLDVNVRLAAEGLGLTVAPQALAAELVASRRLRVVPTDPVLPVASLVLIYRRISADFLQGVQELREAARQLPA